MELLSISIQATTLCNMIGLELEILAQLQTHSLAVIKEKITAVEDGLLTHGINLTYLKELLELVGETHGTLFHISIVFQDINVNSTQRCTEKTLKFPHTTLDTFISLVMITKLWEI